MPNISLENAQDLAKYYSGLSLSAARYRLENWDKLTDTKRKILSDQSWDLAKQSDEYVKRAASLIMNDVKGDLEKIRNVVAEIDETILKITSVQKVIHVMAAALDLGAAILSKNPVSIIKEIEGLVKSWGAVRGSK